MGSEPGLISFSSREQMADRVADLVELSITSAPFADVAGEIAVSGGSTPIAMYEALAGRALNWKCHRLTLVDERWVPLDHPRSNEAAIRKAFAAADGLRIDGLYNAAPTTADGLARAELMCDTRQKPFDAVILGMGADGHTASWFPHAEGLAAALSGDNFVAAVRAKKSAVTGDELDRLTLTLWAIRDARIIILVMSDEAKRVTFEKALQPGPVADMPVRAILRARPDLWACWAP